jgi:diguanylate cyclase (GGDEF)-like protein
MRDNTVNNNFVTKTNNKLEALVPESGDGVVLGARASCRVLIVHLDPQPSGDMQRMRDVLTSVGHDVTVSEYSQWRSVLKNDTVDIVLIEVANESSAVPICRAIRGNSARHAILAIFPRDEDADTTFWTNLQFAGADDFTSVKASRSMLLTRVGVLYRLVQENRELELTRERLANQMRWDETTQLLNRRFFFHNAHRECARARRYGHELSCLMIDIDYLDEIHKKFGYTCVEYVLRTVSTTVRRWIRDSDIAGRFSERKFAVLLTETGVDGATIVRERILKALEESVYQWGGEKIPVNVSIGEAQRRVDLLLKDATEPDDKPKTVPDTVQEGALSVREELASLLEDADAALNVARRASLRPEIFTPYSQGLQESPQKLP